MPAAAQRVLDQFEAMTLGPSGPGQQHEVHADPAYYPRPTGAEAEAAGAPPAAFLPGNCDPRFMRLTVNAIPVQQVGALASFGQEDGTSWKPRAGWAVSTISKVVFLYGRTGGQIRISLGTLVGSLSSNSMADGDTFCWQSSSSTSGQW